MILLHNKWLRKMHCKRRSLFSTLSSVSQFSIIPGNLKHFRIRAIPVHALCHAQLDLNRKLYSNPSSRGLFDVIRSNLIRFSVKLNYTHILTHTQINRRGMLTLDSRLGEFSSISLFSLYSTKAPTRSLRRRISKRKKLNDNPVLDEATFQQAISQLPPRFTAEELFNVITLQEDPLVCFELFNWASQRPRFKHDICTYHITIRKLGAAKMYQEMDDVVNQVLSVRHIGNENLYNSIVFYFTQARKLTRAVNIFKHMKSSRNLGCRPTVRTYHILFKALLSRGKNSHINHVYMETIRSLFKQMVDDGIEPDVFALNCMIKGYVLSLHVNDALRIFHQMVVVYNCQPNSFSYDYLIHGLCAQGRTINAKEMCDEMKTKGFIPSSKSYNSLVNALALSGEVHEAVTFLWEMIDKDRMVDCITYRTVLDEMYRKGNDGEAMRLLKMLRQKELVDGDVYKKLMNVLRD